MIWHLFCDKCGLDTYIENEFKPNKCPKCGEVKDFIASREPRDNEELKLGVK